MIQPMLNCEDPLMATQNQKIPLLETITKEEKMTLHHPRRHL
jgi:hypothetical protein